MIRGADGGRQAGDGDADDGDGSDTRWWSVECGSGGGGLAEMRGVHHNSSAGKRLLYGQRTHSCTYGKTTKK